MIKVYVTKQSNFPVSTPKIKKELKEFFKKQGVTSDAVVDVAIVGKNKMLKLAEKFLNEKNNLHSVLSFTESETKKDFVYPPGDTLYLGEIVVCYPKVVSEANTEGKLIDEKAIELVKHSALHLLGIHHKE